MREPFTQEQIDQNMEASRARANKLRAEVLERRAESKRVSTRLREQGFTLYYMDPVSIAFKPTAADPNEFYVFYTVRSKRDQFCRANARAALNQREMLGTQYLKVRGNPRGSSKEFSKFISAVIDALWIEALEYPERFPAYFRRIAVCAGSAKRFVEVAEILKAGSERHATEARKLVATAIRLIKEVSPDSRLG